MYGSWSCFFHIRLLDDRIVVLSSSSSSSVLVAYLDLCCLTSNGYTMAHTWRRSRSISARNQEPGFNLKARSKERALQGLGRGVRAVRGGGLVVFIWIASRLRKVMHLFQLDYYLPPLSFRFYPGGVVVASIASGSLQVRRPPSWSRPAGVFFFSSIAACRKTENIFVFSSSWSVLVAYVRDFLGLWGAVRWAAGYARWSHRGGGGGGEGSSLD
jgi:hypothetical protein